MLETILQSFTFALCLSLTIQRYKESLKYPNKNQFIFNGLLFFNRKLTNCKTILKNHQKFGSLRFLLYLCIRNQGIIPRYRLNRFSVMVNTIEKEYNELVRMTSNMKYEDAFKQLNGYNLTADPVTCGKNKELITINEFFDVTYKHINTSIFRTENNGCEVWEEFSVHMVMNCEGDVELA